MRFQGRVALVSGAGSGIGRAVAEAFGREGASVVLLGRSEAKLRETASRLPAGRALVSPARHENPAEVAGALERALGTLGRLDILVNNAGAYVEGSLAETSPEAWSEALAANLTGPYVLTREALPHLRKRRGTIVNVSSSLGIRPIAGAFAYCVAKAGLNMFTQALALEEAGAGIRVNAVCPGVIDTPIHRQRVGDDEARLRAFLGQMAEAHPLKRVGTPEEVAAIVLFLASDASAFTTGTIVAVDGGISLA